MAVIHKVGKQAQGSAAIQTATTSAMHTVKGRHSMKRVFANHIYTYYPCMLDVCDARTDLKPGDRVRVVNLPGCPPCNTMRHAHVVDPFTNKFIGLVCTASLKSNKRNEAL